MSLLIQIISTVIICSSCMNMGIILGWPSSTILLFKSENTTLQRPMNDIEISLLGSISAVGSLTFIPLSGLLMDRLGRKYTTILSSLIYVMAWSLISISNRIEIILIAMALGGAGCSVFPEATIYISEISPDSIRGTLSACPNQFYCLGFLVSYLLGGALGYHAMVYACLSFSVLSVLMISILKESPVTLMMKGKENDAAKAIAFYRSSNPSSMEVVNELNNIRRSLNPDSGDAQSLAQGEKKMVSRFGTKKQSCWQFYKGSSSTRREFYLVMALKTAYICQGLPILQVYAEPMFSAAIGDLISPNLCSVIFGVVVLVSGTISAYLVDIIGRRPLQIYTSFATGICCVILGIQMMTEWLPKWTMPLFVYAAAMLHTAGSGTVTLVVLGEVFLPEVKSILSMLAVEWAWICFFFCLFLFNLVVQALGLSPVFFFFSVVCFSASVYFFYYLPETKGLPVYAIQKLFTTNK